MRKRKCLILILSFFMVLIFMIRGTSVSASDAEDLSQYYENSDLIYYMSDESDIHPYTHNGDSNYTIDRYKDELLATNMKYNYGATINGDDPIVNIIPRKYFVEETELTVVGGSEYAYAIETKKSETLPTYYISHVMVVDIENNIKENNYDIESYQISVTLNKLFEYEYVTLLKEYNYMPPNNFIDNIDDSSIALKVASSYIGDDVVAPLPSNYVRYTYIPIHFDDLNEWKINDINIIGQLTNTNDYNQSDDNYKSKEDDGYFFIGDRVEYLSNETELIEYGYNPNWEEITGDCIGVIMSFFPIPTKVDVTLGLIELGSDLIFVDDSEIIHNTYTSEDYFSSEPHEFVSTRDGQIEE